MQASPIENTFHPSRKLLVILSMFQSSGKSLIVMLVLLLRSNTHNILRSSGQGHGDWPLELSSNQLVAQAAKYLIEQIK